MSDSRQYLARDSRLKFESGKTGWYGEGFFRARARAFFARMVHKANRRFAKRTIEQEVNDLRVNGAI